MKFSLRFPLRRFVNHLYIILKNHASNHLLIIFLFYKFGEIAREVQVKQKISTNLHFTFSFNLLKRSSFSSLAAWALSCLTLFCSTILSFCQQKEIKDSFYSYKLFFVETKKYYKMNGISIS